MIVVMTLELSEEELAMFNIRASTTSTRSWVLKSTTKAVAGPG